MTSALLPAACGSTCATGTARSSDEVRRWAIGKTALIGFIDLMLLGRPLPRLQQRAARAAPVPAQERLRGQRQPRAQDAARPHPALRRDPGARPRPERGARRAVLPRHQQGEPAPDPAHQQHPRLLAHRGRAQGVPLRADRRGPRSWTTCSRPTASRSSSRASRSRWTSRTTCPRSRSTTRPWPGAHQPRSTTRSSTARDDKHDQGRGARARTTACCVSVTDRGIGIAQAPSRSRSSRSSTGPRTAWCTRPRAAASGSPSCSHIMEAHGGSVELESAPGRGEHLHPGPARRAEGGMSRTGREERG